MRDLERPGRSPVLAPTAMAATSHPLATQTAVEVMRQGGNAMDAAVAACAVQCVAEPGSTGIGGDCFCLYAREGTDDVIAYNGSGAAPAAATTQWYADQGIAKIERQSPHAVTIPGAVEAWARLIADHGRISLAELLAPAVSYARNGVPIAPRVSTDFASQAALLAQEANVARVMLPGGTPPAVGQILRQPELADTMEAIAKNGPDVFYSGAVAENMVGFLQSRGGLHSLDDFAAHNGEYVDPISTEFRGHQVHQCPPNGQGVTALMLLNIMQGYDPDPDGPLTAARVHTEIEAGRLAYRDRNLYLADPRHADVPLEWLLSEAHASDLRAAINSDRALTEMPIYTAPRHDSTVYICVVDKDRNVCSFINTIFAPFGSVQMDPRSGVLFHNRGMGFSLIEGHPNAIAPGKRPLHTIIPGLVTRNGQTEMAYGVMGGQYQAFGHMQLLTRYFDYDLDIQEAIDLPRFFPDPSTGKVEVEGPIPSDLRAELKRFGHALTAPVRPVGGAQAIRLDRRTGALIAGSDARKDGCAIGY